MSKLRVHSFGMSIDGYGAGPDQSLENPLGLADLHCTNGPSKRVLFTLWRAKEGWPPGVMMTSSHVASTTSALGSLGENMFGPVRAHGRTTLGRGGGAKIRRITPLSSFSPDHARSSLAMSGGTTFHFVTDGIDNALTRAAEASEEKISGWAAGRHNPSIPSCRTRR